MISRSYLNLGLGVALAVTIAACARPVFHRNGATYPAKPGNCQLRVMGAHPGPGWEEIGTITIEGDRSAGAGSFQDGEEFVDRIRPEVCAAGADAVMTEVNGFGVVARGVAFRKVADVPEKPEIASVPAPAPPPAPDGCEPICSPGFACQKGICVPQCNPACGPEETCGRDRLCHAASAAAAASSP
jgi:hypothetical protein